MIMVKRCSHAANVHLVRKQRRSLSIIRRSERSRLRHAQHRPAASGQASAPSKGATERATRGLAACAEQFCPPLPHPISGLWGSSLSRPASMPGNICVLQPLRVEGICQVQEVLPGVAS